MKSRFEKARKWLLFWTLFIGIGAVGGSACMLFDPSGKLLGMDAMLPFFKKLPLADILFADFAFSGYALLIVNGLTNLTAAVLLLGAQVCGRGVQLRIRRDADALDLHSVLHVPVQLHVDRVLHIRTDSGDYRLCGVRILPAGAFCRKRTCLPARRQGRAQGTGRILFAHGLRKETGDGGGQRYRRGRVRGALDRAYRGHAGLLVVRALRHAPLGYAHRADRRRSDGV